MQARIYVTLKQGVLDPQGEAVRHALGAMGFDGVHGVRQGKLLDVELDAASRDEAEARLREMCEKLLANTVIEDFRVELL
ncbi:phosphoribosylformylglycinamidine synthase subunit PurS [Rhodobacteraceae bacterium 2CG4]|uniref:Phosphoribosylformylglycinamidine synthase subunit PurS n=1 Tax=Halovulum marinum TaxID=2662447 RepID=A0A6L5Z4L6_9RHOB|nr:phosphoribosylformylglycinamidine synthase subunit PurS [Halovulum marinum]MSU91397.1 phosphoribosylformylglycinamidine synthase subunit PurS [Halovulum marinum]